MSNEKPHIFVHGFRQTFEELPVKGDPLNDNVDNLGYRLDEKGKVIKKLQEEDWVSYSPSHSVQNSVTTERVRHLMPDHVRAGRDDDGSKAAFMKARWDQIEPHYRAWKEGRELPVDGFPLHSWPGITPEAADVLLKYQIRTVQQVRDLSEQHLERIPLPSLRDMKKRAGVFLDSLESDRVASREAEKDAQIAGMAEQIKALSEKLSSMEPAKAEADDEVAVMRAELDKRGIEYDGRWAAPKLRALLAETEQAA